MLTVADVVLLVLAGSFLTGALWLDGQPAVQAQDDQGTISNQPEPRPVGCRRERTWRDAHGLPGMLGVCWAPSGQDYLAYAEAITSEGGSAYPNTVSFTVNDLSPGTEYKVQVRARYNQRAARGQFLEQRDHRHGVQPTNTRAGTQPHCRTYEEPTPEPTEEPTSESEIGGWPLLWGIQQFGEW